MAEYKYVDWPGLQYYHSKVTDLIDSRLRDCIRFGGEVLFETLESPDTPDLNIIYKILNSFTVSPVNPSKEWFDNSMWNKTYPAGTLLQVVQTERGVVYTVFMQPAQNGESSDVDLSNYYTIEETDAKIIEALKPYATEDFVKQKIAEAQLSGGEVDLSIFYTKGEIDAKGFATEEYVQQQLDEADVVGMDARITVLETNTTTVTGRVDAVEDQAEANEAAITALSGEIDRVDKTLLNMDTQIINISQNLADLQAYGTF